MIKIERIDVYPEFKAMENTFKYIDIKINYATAQENVPEIESEIKTIK